MSSIYCYFFFELLIETLAIASSTGAILDLELIFSLSGLTGALATCALFLVFLIFFISSSSVISSATVDLVLISFLDLPPTESIND
jgi:hypothetical protein